MKVSTLIFCLFMSAQVFAGTKGFEIQLNDISVNGSIFAQPRKLTVAPNQPVVISRSIDSAGVNTVIEMKVSDDSSLVKDGILISLSMIEEKEGSRKVVGTPQMIIKSGHAAHMTQGKEGEEATFKASLIGTRIE